MTPSDKSKTAVERAHEGWFYATKPTSSTLFLRTFLPWQIYRFLYINLKMVGMIRLSHRGQRH